MQERQDRVIDYTSPRRGRGHDYTFTPENGGLTARMMGWGPRREAQMKRGDVILLSNPQSESGLAPYRITSISYYSDPPDMWRAGVEFAPDIT